MIAKMTQYSFILLHGDKEQFLSELQGLGVMDITRASKPVDTRSQSLLDNIRTLRDDIACTEKGMDDTLAELLATRGALERELAEAEPWGDYDRGRLAVFGLHFYRVASKKYDPAWEEQYAIQVVDRDEKEDTRFVIVGDDAGFPLKELPAPKRTVAELKTLLQEQDEKIDAHRKILEARKADIPQMRHEIRVLENELDRYLAATAAVPAAEDTVDTLVGFAPTENDAAVTEYLDQAAVYYVKSEATLEDNPPIELKNNKFVKMFEVLTDMYGRPDYNEFDPTPYISVFFLLFFAMCMGDAGYGLLLAIIGILLRKSDGMKSLAPLVTVLGIGTFVVGIVMHTFFGVDISQLAWIPSWLKAVMITGTIGGFEAQMVLSLAIGIVHLCLAMVVKTVYATRNKGFLGSLGVWGWTLLIVGGVALGTLAMLSLLPAGVVKVIFIVLGVVSALGIFLFNDIHRNPLKNIGSGLWEAYNTVTGLLGDVLSYLRLYALGLAGGMLGKAFNDIATMTLGDGSFGFGWFTFALILVIGHALNLAMCCLGAFVHPLRLNFLEFFKNSGYDGKGRVYNPLSSNNN
ncbi:V/A-type H+-transporting ATPase subunit I [Bacteroidales bacterium WCE2004]|nr:V/A-type H+-transporting ATPase subunit I [Bacteroidales bacterium WCE2004]